MIRILTRISHTFCDTEAIRSEKVSRCKSLTATGQADPFRQSVFQPSAGRLMDIGEPPQPASVFRAKCSRLCRCEKCGLTLQLGQGDVGHLGQRRVDPISMGLGSTRE